MCGRFPNSTNIAQYDPFHVQEKRELVTLDNIARGMAGSENGGFVIGLAHLFSLSLRRSSDFDLKSFAYHPEIF